MTAQVFPIMEEGAAGGETRREAPRFLRVLASSMLFPFAPWRNARVWLETSAVRAGVAAGIHFLSAWAWLYLVVVFYQLWDRSGRVPVGERLLWGRIAGVAAGVPGQISQMMRGQMLLDWAAMVVALVLFVVIGFAIPFFVLLPFAARPGSAKPCVRHVARTVLLASGGVHVWGAAFVTAFVVLIQQIAVSPDYSKMLATCLFLITALGIWGFMAMVAAARMDYRRVGDHPQAHDPWCDDCGYNLIAAEAQGRCPECGRLVSDSLGSHTRPPTAWEANPKPWKVGVVLQQLGQLVRRPRTLFFSMPTLTGQRAAQRWLMMSLLAIGMLAALIVPGIVCLEQAAWGMIVFTGSLAMAFVWTVLAAMMVGIETAGIVAVARMRAGREGRTPGHAVFLSAAAKVTCYSSILMTVWVILGGLQLVLAVHYLPLLMGAPGKGLRAQQILLAGSLSAAHIGGLLWYEFTVYRGIRAIQYANK